MKQIYELFGLLLLFGSASFLSAQCNPTDIGPKSAWSIAYVDSEETQGEGPDNGRAIHAIDDIISTFWHTEWQNEQTPYPHEIVIDLSAQHDVAGFYVLSRYDTAAGKPRSYEVFTGTDNVEWTLQSAGELIYDEVNAPEQYSEEVLFGAVTGRYVKLRFLDAYGDYYYTVLSEIYVKEDLDCPATGQVNQVGVFESIPKKYTTDDPFELIAELNSGLNVNFEVVSGPAVIDGNTMTLTGEAGFVEVKASQPGNSDYYPWEQTQTFEVVDLTLISPEISARFTDEEDIRMRSLSPYLLYVYAHIDEPEQLNITSVEIEYEGETESFELVAGTYEYWWTPQHYGENTVEITAHASNGKSTSKTYHFNVSDSMSDRTVTTFDGDVIDMGTIGSQWFYGNYTLPQFVDAYDKILANFSVSCPAVPGGCDDWDRLGWVEVKSPGGNWVEIFRYITPYGVPCGSVIDVTDYASLLQGEVEIRMYIETWGTGGWGLHLDFEYEQGEPEFKYSKVLELWKGNFPFGDMANLQPVPQKTVQFSPEVEDAKIRLVTTGHGWGDNNTGNAAEFYHAYHHIQVDQQNTFEQDLWQICNPNPDGCTGQMGTWQYNRAGWCPGSSGKIYFYDLEPFIDQTSVNLDYEFQPSYRDFCHVNNPDCVSGSTCPDCNDSYNPYYRVGGYLIRYYNQPYSLLGTEEFSPEATLSATLYPNPARESFSIRTEDGFEASESVMLTLFDVSGRTVKALNFGSMEELNKTEIDISGLPPGVYFVQLIHKGLFTNLRLLKR